METAIFILTAFNILLVFALYNANKRIIDIERKNAADREQLINKHVSDREHLVSVLTDKILKRNGVTPVFEKEEKPPQSDRIQTNGHRRQR